MDTNFEELAEGLKGEGDFGAFTVAVPFSGIFVTGGNTEALRHCEAVSLTFEVFQLQDGSFALAPHGGKIIGNSIVVTVTPDYPTLHEWQVAYRRQLDLEDRAKAAKKH